MRRAAGRLYGEERPEVQKLREVAQDFEAVFMSMVLKEMRGTQEKGMLHGGLGEDFFTEMLDEEFAKAISKRGGTGIGDMLFQQLSRRLNLKEEEGRSQDLLNASQSAGDLQRKLRTVTGEMKAAGAALNAEP